MGPRKSQIRLCVNSEPAWGSKAYERLDYIMRLYGALVQTDVRGGIATNIHGIEHGWAWFARYEPRTRDLLVHLPTLIHYTTRAFKIRKNQRIQKRRSSDESEDTNGRGSIADLRIKWVDSIAYDDQKPEPNGFSKLDTMLSSGGVGIQFSGLDQTYPDIITIYYCVCEEGALTKYAAMSQTVLSQVVAVASTAMLPTAPGTQGGVLPADGDVAWTAEMKEMFNEALQILPAKSRRVYNIWTIMHSTYPDLSQEEVGS
ncbi:unnamed protein product [Arabis nemorensis]|uniref:Uncharacterized protein n=1 Tax=Arabis nemorensis TaxID=586526 RepID=A0A565CTB2_9BRAS|nr:unnamed protein product [Arabis nemorensis]